MKILHLSSAMSWRGGEQQIAYLMEELRDQGIEQVVFCAAGSKMQAYCEKCSFPHQTYRKVFSLNPLVGWQLRNYCRKEKIDLVHVHDNHAHTFAWLSAGLFRNRVPIVVSRRVDFPVRKNRLSLAKYQHPRVKRILCVSEAIRQIVLNDLPRPELVQVVYSGIDLDRFQVSPDGRLRKELNLPEAIPLIGNVAAIAPHKDYETFVQTAQLLLQDGLDARFLIIGGDGGKEAAIRQQVHTLGLEEKILFTGFRKDIPHILPELAIFLFTSKTEGLGTSLLDSFAAGVPVVATRAGGATEIVRHQATALTAEVGDATTLANHVRTLLNDSQLRKQLIAGAHREVQKFSKHQTARQTLEHYREVLEID